MLGSIEQLLVKVVLTVLIAALADTVCGAVQDIGGSIQVTNTVPGGVQGITNAPALGPTNEFWQAKSRSASQTSWIVTRLQTNGDQVLTSTNAFVEIASGLNVNLQGSWRPAHSEFSLTASGAAEAT